MVRLRLLILLGGLFLAASTALADEIGFIDCHDRSENTQVLAKAAKTSEVVASLPCGERFAILVLGQVFSRIQTRDANIGYVYTYLISRDYSAPSVTTQLAPTSSVSTVSQPAPERTPGATPCPPLPEPAAPANGDTIPVGARLYIAPMGGFETYLAAAIKKKGVPVTLTLDNCTAAYAFATAEQISNGWVFRSGGNWEGWGASGGSTRTVEASIMLVNMRTKDVAWAYAVHKSSNGGLLFGTLALRGQQSAAEACAKHLKAHVQ